ncbi:glycosyltransferase family 1 protein [Empedobacter falsenii]|uniref:glycosyltransferase family 1 protein n=1 Tax=Empedobacter falsenii TaxID=343874 RepID=UPI003A7FDEDB
MKNIINDNNPIRILHVVTIMNLGGIETFLMTLYRNIDRSKIQFDFLVHRKEEGLFDKEIKELGGRILYVPPLNPFKIFNYRNSFNKILNKSEYQYKVIHSHLNANSTIVLAIAKENNIPVRIAHSHIDNVGSGIKGISKSITKLFINNVANYRFACSNKAGNWLFGKHNRFEIYNNGIETSNFLFNKDVRCSIRNLLKINDSTVVFGNIARFTKQKNHDFIIDIFEDYNKNINTDSVLLLIGEGPLFNEMKSKAEKLGIASNVIFLGAIKNANEYINAFDLFIFPSLFEGLGIVAIESQANGLPILASNNIPSEINISDLVYRLDLNLSVKEWSQQMHKILLDRKVRTSDYNLIKDSGFDISEICLKLEDFYLNKYN